MNTARPSVEVPEDELAPVVRAYLTSVLLPSTQGKMNPRSQDELRALGEIVDSILLGDAVRAAEIALQRFKAVETCHTDGGWHQAKFLTPLKDSAVSSLSLAEHSLLAKAEKEDGIDLELILPG